MIKQNSEFNFNIKSLQGDGVFSGYASVFGVVDNQNDVIMKGAFSRSLTQRAGKVKMLWQHDVEKPIGKFSILKEDGYGLYVEGKITLDIQQGREAFALLKNQAINGLSIGYTVNDADINGDNNIRLIKDVDLWEISLVTFPANEEAIVTGVKENSVISENEDDHLLKSLDRALYVLGTR